jgi:hypothetical protein
MAAPARKEDDPLFQTIAALIDEAIRVRGYDPPFTFVCIGDDGSVVASAGKYNGDKGKLDSEVICSYRAGGNMYPLNFFFLSPGREILRATLEGPGIAPKWIN